MTERKKQPRVFEDVVATRTSVPLMVGLVGPSGGGKTFSALRLATGFQRVDGGDIYFVDTEARRALHYADRFKFRHVVFGAPFGPLDYLEAIQYCVSKGAKTIIVDSMSHEHEGPGGVLEMHEAEVQRLGGQDRHNFPAWAKPKAERRRMINSLLQQPCNFIFCFRAKEKTKPKGGKLEDLGFMPIAGEEFVYEMTLNALLLPNAGGVPTWTSEFTGEKQMIKLPEQFRKQLIDSRQPLSEDVGEMLARWAAGGGPAVKPQSQVPSQAPARNESEGQLLFGAKYPVLGGKPVEAASLPEIAKYITYLQGILDAAPADKKPSNVVAHKAAVDTLYEQLMAEEALGGASDDEAAQ